VRGLYFQQVDADSFAIVKRALDPRMRYLLGKWCRQLAGMTTISEINLELVNYCNLGCRWCALDHALPKVVMGEDLLRKLLENLASDRRFRSVRKLNLYSGGGEPLLHRDLAGVLATIKEFKLRSLERRRPFPIVHIVTNATTLNDRVAATIIESEVVDDIRFSIDGGTREAFEELRSGAHWDAVAGYIKNFAQRNRGRVRTGIICVVAPGRPLNTGWMSEEFRELAAQVDNIEMRHPHDFRGDVVVEGRTKRFRDYCYFLFHQLVLRPDGGVVVCCVDSNGIGKIGNFRESDLFAIYSSPQRKAMLRNLMLGRRDRIDLCKNCSGYYPGENEAGVERLR